jgi:hypothetical protein
VVFSLYICFSRDRTRALLHEIPFIKESFGVSLDQSAVAKSYDRDTPHEEKDDHEIQSGVSQFF